MRTTDRVSMVMAAVTMVCVWAAPGRAEAWTIGLGGQIYGDDGEIDGVKRVGPQAPQRQDRQFYADNTASVAIWALTARSERSRWGGGVRFYGGYGLIDDGAEENVAEGEEVPVYDLGTLADIYGQLEWLLPVLEGDHEVDFIIGDHTAVAVKAKTNVAGKDLRSLRALAEEDTMKRSICVCLESRRRAADGGRDLSLAPPDRRHHGLRRRDQPHSA